MITIRDLHDATLVDIRIEWKDSSVTAAFHAQLLGHPNLTMRATEFHLVRIPRQEAWGPSISVNKMETSAVENGAQSMRIEMQSGDVIEIIAKQFHWETDA